MGTMNENCPWCNSAAIEISTHDSDFDQRQRFMCAGPETHRWRDGDGPEPELPEREPLIVLARG